MGVAAVQIARAVGARVVAAAAGADKAAFLRQQLGLGREQPVAAQGMPGAAAASGSAQGQGHVVLDTADLEAKGIPLHKAIKAAAPKGEAKQHVASLWSLCLKAVSLGTGLAGLRLWKACGMGHGCGRTNQAVEARVNLPTYQRLTTTDEK